MVILAHLALAALAAAGVASASSVLARRGKLNMIPKFSYSPDTVKYCAWWLDNDGTWTCPEIQEAYGLSMTDFQRWNPSIELPCDLLPRNQSFCIAASEGRQIMTVEITVSAGPTVTVSAVGTATVTVSRAQTVTVNTGGGATVTVPVTVPVSVPIPIPTTVTTTVTSVPIPERGTNGLTTPLPYQAGMVNNCKTFYFVQQGETCDNIAARFRIAEKDVVDWNPSARPDCTNLLANNYCCVGVL